MKSFDGNNIILSGANKVFDSETAFYWNCLYSSIHHNQLFRFNHQLSTLSEDGRHYVFHHYLIPVECVEQSEAQNLHECNQVFRTATEEILPNSFEQLYFILNESQETVYFQSHAPGEQVTIETKNGQKIANFETPLILTKDDFPITIQDSSGQFSLSLYDNLLYNYHGDRSRSLQHYLSSRRHQDITKPISTSFLHLKNEVSGLQQVLNDFQQLLHKSPIFHALFWTGSTLLSICVIVIIFCVLSSLCCPTRLREWLETLMYQCLYLACCCNFCESCRRRRRTNQNNNNQVPHGNQQEMMPLQAQAQA